MNSNVPQDVARIAATVDQDHGRELRRFLARRLANPSDVADLAQEVYLRLLRLDRSKPVHKPRAFLYGVASHVLADFRLQSAPATANMSLDSEAGRLQADSANVVEDATARLNLAQQLERAFKELPPIQQAVLLLLKRDGMSYEEVAEKLSLSVDMVHKHAVWAKSRLRTMKWER